MKIAIGSDHAGFEYKSEIIRFLQSKGHEVTDFGTDSEVSVDYPQFIFPVAEAVANGSCEFGFILGGSGNGEAMTANRVKNVRCALCFTEELTELARRHNNANIASFGQRVMKLTTVLKCVDLFLKTPFDGGRHTKRIQMIDNR
ncbi:MAG: ribose 5-phosphate isomerase B [Chitinivibrionales bacterium]|nr:ribose 5-phosphate isomerase B [Chitinivibrionales bacterium]